MFKKIRKDGGPPKEISTGGTMDDEISMLQEEGRVKKESLPSDKNSKPNKKSKFPAAGLVANLQKFEKGLKEKVKGGRHGSNKKVEDEEQDFLTLLNTIDTSEASGSFGGEEEGGPSFESLLESIEEVNNQRIIRRRSSIAGQTGKAQLGEETAESVIIKEKIENVVDQLTQEHEELKEQGVQVGEGYISSDFKNLADDFDCEDEGVAIGIDDEDAIIPLQALARGYLARVDVKRRREMMRQDAENTQGCVDVTVSALMSSLRKLCTGRLFRR